MASNVNVERNPSSKDDEKRSRQFRSVLLVAWVAVPLYCLVERVLIGFGDDGVKWLFIYLDLGLLAFAWPAFAVFRGRKVAGRHPIVVWHVAVTIHLFGVAASLLVLPGWDHKPDGPHWWDDVQAWLANVFVMPMWIWVAYMVISLCVAGTWWLPRIDAFRADARGDADGQSKLEQLLKWPTAAKVRASSITADEHAIEAVIDHPGVPVAHLQSALPAVVEYSGAVRGRSSVVPGDRGGQSTIRLVKEDPLDEWKPWPGLSHPGGSFAYPFRTAYYTDGRTQWYSFAQTPAKEILPPSRVAPKFKSANDAHVGRQGATRSGKSGDNAIELAEAYSRRDCIVLLVNTAKLTQDVGWGLDFAGLAADTKPKAALLFAAIKKIGEYRSNAMGDPRWKGRHRVWSPLTYTELGFAALFLQVDEGDTVLTSEIAKWIGTKGLSLGIFMSVMISRAMTDGMNSTLRSAITQWKCFGAGQAYDSGFVLSEETIAAGADPGALSTRFPGSHYLDKAQGVDEERYPVLARSYQTARDFSDLRREVENARTTFDPARFTSRELEILGPVAEALSPSALLFGHFPNDEPTAMSAVEAMAHAMEEGLLDMDEDDPDRAALHKALNIQREEIDMHDTMSLDDMDDAEVDEMLKRSRAEMAELEQEYGALPPPGEPMPDLATPGAEPFALDDGDDRPHLSGEETEAEFDAALIRLADRLLVDGKKVARITNGDIMGEMRCQPNPTFVSRRLKAICDDGKAVPPAGLTLERKGAGKFDLSALHTPSGGHAG